MFLSSSNRIFHLSLQNLCIKIMKRRLYIFSIWIATMGMLLSTVMLHHHHYERICMVVEACSQDGSLNDEHTEHHDTEHEGCQVKQMHHFIVSARVVKMVNFTSLSFTENSTSVPSERPIQFFWVSLILSLHWMVSKPSSRR